MPGFDNYNTTITTSKTFAAEKKARVQRVVTASLEGLRCSIQGRARNEAANAHGLKRDNPDNDRRQDRLCDQRS